MKIQANSKAVNNVGDSKAFQITASASAFKILSSSLYENKEEAVLREVAANALDANIAANRPDWPISVKLPSALDTNLTISDVGPGMSRDQLENLYTTYFESTKSGDNNATGGFGLGSKSPFALSDSFSVESTTDSGEYTSIVCYKDDGAPQLTVIEHDLNSDRESGTKVIVPMKAGNDEIVKAAKKVFRFWNTPPKINLELDEPIEQHITDGIKHYGYNKDYNQQWIVIGEFGYQIPNAMVSRMREAFKKSFENICNVSSYHTNLPILWFDIGELELAPSRERIEITDENEDTICQAMNTFAMAVSKSTRQSAKQIADYVLTTQDMITVAGLKLIIEGQNVDTTFLPAEPNNRLYNSLMAPLETMTPAEMFKEGWKLYQDSLGNWQSDRNSFLIWHNDYRQNTGHFQFEVKYINPVTYKEMLLRKFEELPEVHFSRVSHSQNRVSFTRDVKNRYRGSQIKQILVIPNNDYKAWLHGVKENFTGNRTDFMTVQEDDLAEVKTYYDSWVDEDLEFKFVSPDEFVKVGLAYAKAMKGQKRTKPNPKLTLQQKTLGHLARSDLTEITHNYYAVSQGYLMEFNDYPDITVHCHHHTHYNTTSFIEMAKFAEAMGVTFQIIKPDNGRISNTKAWKAYMEKAPLQKYAHNGYDIFRTLHQQITNVAKLNLTVPDFIEQYRAHVLIHLASTMTPESWDDLPKTALFKYFDKHVLPSVDFKALMADQQLFNHRRDYIWAVANELEIYDQWEITNWLRQECPLIQAQASLNDLEQDHVKMAEHLWLYLDACDLPTKFITKTTFSKLED